jgi:hypothetical protein
MLDRFTDRFIDHKLSDEVFHVQWFGVIELYVKVITNCQKLRILEKVVVACLEVISSYSSGKSEDK